MGHRCPSSDARGLGADRRWRRRRDHVRNAKNTGGTNMHRTRADGYGCIRCSLYRALGLTGLIRLHTCHAPHVPCTCVQKYICTVHYSRSIVRYTRYSPTQYSITFTLEPRTATAGYSVHDRSLDVTPVNEYQYNVIKVTHLKRIYDYYGPEGPCSFPGSGTANRAPTPAKRIFLPIGHTALAYPYS